MLWWLRFKVHKYKFHDRRAIVSCILFRSDLGFAALSMQVLVGILVAAEILLRTPVNCAGIGTF